jgi:hypothetical protein
MIGVHRVEVAEALRLAREQLHDLHPDHVLLEVGVDARDPHAHRAKRLAHLPAEHERADREQRHDQEREPGQARVDAEEREREAEHLEHVAHERRDPGREHLRDVLDVVGRARDEAADRHRVEEAEVQALDVREHLAPQVAHRGLTGARHHERIDVRDEARERGDREVDPGEPRERRDACRRLERARARGDRALRDRPRELRHQRGCGRPRRGRRRDAGRARHDLAVDPGLDDPGGRELEEHQRK